MTATSDGEAGIKVAGTDSRVLDPTDQGEGRLRYLSRGTGAPLIMLHTVRTQAEHFRDIVPLVQDRYTVYALNLPGMGYSQIVPGASYEEPAMRRAVERLITQLDLRDVTLLGESMGAVYALTAAADMPDRIRRVLAVNAFDYADGDPALGDRGRPQCPNQESDDMYAGPERSLTCTRRPCAR